MESKSEPLTVSSEAAKKRSIILIIVVLLAIILLISTIIVGAKLSSKSSNYDDLNKKYTDLEAKYNEIEKKYDNQNTTINDVFNSFQGLISNTTMPSTKIKKEDYVNIKAKLNTMKKFEDGTYSYVDQKKISYPKGYHVSFETRTRYYEYYYTDEEYDNLVYKLACLLGVNADLGVFNNFPMISFYIEDKQLALSIAALFNQQSIWDWSTNTTILNTLHQPKYY